jgi:hypothetical protein
VQEVVLQTEVQQFALKTTLLHRQIVAQTEAQQIVAETTEVQHIGAEDDIVRKTEVSILDAKTDDEGMPTWYDEDDMDMRAKSEAKDDGEFKIS